MSPLGEGQAAVTVFFTEAQILLVSAFTFIPFLGDVAQSGWAP